MAIDLTVLQRLFFKNCRLSFCIIIAHCGFFMNSMKSNLYEPKVEIIAFILDADSSQNFVVVQTFFFLCKLQTLSNQWLIRNAKAIVKERMTKPLYQQNYSNYSSST